MAEIISGKIIKGIGGFYYIDAEDGHLYECKAKGIFRNKKIKPLVGDNVNIEILDPENNLGNIVEILPRFNSLIRPAVANVDQTIIIFAVSEPEPNFNLLDRFLVSMEKSGVETIICFNKTDLSPDNMEACRSYSKSGYETIFISARRGHRQAQGDHKRPHNGVCGAIGSRQVVYSQCDQARGGGPDRRYK